MVTPTPEDEMFAPAEGEFLGEVKTDDATSNEISELSKKGYSLLKENRISDAREAFQQILSLGSILYDLSPSFATSEFTIFLTSAMRHPVRVRAC